MRLQKALVTAWNNHQATIATVNMLHGSPGTDDAVCRSEWEVVQVCRDRECVLGVMRCVLLALVQGVSGGEETRIRWLVD